MSRIWMSTLLFLWVLVLPVQADVKVRTLTAEEYERIKAEIDNEKVPAADGFVDADPEAALESPHDKTTVEAEKLQEMSDLSRDHFLCMELAATAQIGSEDERLLSNSMKHWAEAVRLFREQFDLMMEVSPPALLEQMQPAFELGLGADYFAGALQSDRAQRVTELINVKCRNVEPGCNMDDRSMFAVRIYRDQSCYSLIKNN